MTYRNPNQSRMRLDVRLVALAPKAQPRDDGGDDKLRRQDRVHLADELVADVDGGLGHGPAELEVVGQVVLAAARRSEDVGRCVVAAVVATDGLLIRRWCLRPGARIRVLRRRGRVFRVRRHRLRFLSFYLVIFRLLYM